MFAIIEYPHYEIESSIWFDYTKPDCNNDSINFHSIKTIFYTIEETNQYVEQLKLIAKNLKNVSNAYIWWHVYKINEPPNRNGQLIIKHNSKFDKEN